MTFTLDEQETRSLQSEVEYVHFNLLSPGEFWRHKDTLIPVDKYAKGLPLGDWSKTHIRCDLLPVEEQVFISKQREKFLGEELAIFQEKLKTATGVWAQDYQVSIDRWNEKLEFESEYQRVTLANLDCGKRIWINQGKYKGKMGVIQSVHSGTMYEPKCYHLQYWVKVDKTDEQIRLERGEFDLLREFGKKLKNSKPKQEKEKFSPDERFSPGDRVQDKEFPLNTATVICSHQNVVTVSWDGVDRSESMRADRLVKINSKEEQNPQFRIGDAVAPSWAAGKDRRGQVIEILGKNQFRIKWDNGTVGKVRSDCLTLIEDNEEYPWNSAHFGDTPRQVEPNGQLTVFWDTSAEPPDPDDFTTRQEFEEAWDEWEQARSSQTSTSKPWSEQIPQGHEFCYKQLLQKGFDHKYAVAVIRRLSGIKS